MESSMSIPRRCNPAYVSKKSLLLDWWLVRFASIRMAGILTYRTIRDRDTPDHEIDLEMQAFHLDLTDHDDDHNTSRPEWDLEKGDV
jgi:hypothetical protein